MTSRSLSVSERLQQSIREGKSQADLVQDLVARGLSAPSAERIVARAMQDAASGRQTAPAISSPSVGTSDDDEARGALISGAFWFSLGATITAATYFLARPGGRFVFAYGAIAAGLVAFVRGLSRFRATEQVFPWRAIFLSGAAPVGFLLVVIFVVGFQIERRRGQRQKGEDERLEAVYAVRERQAATRKDELAREQQAALLAAQERERQDRISRARLQLLAFQSTIACDAATSLEKDQAIEAIPDLVSAVDRVTNSESVRNCAAHALVVLGAPDRAVAFFKECVRVGTPTARNYASSGFAAMGPSMAEFALPLLREDLRSPYPDRRYVAVENLQQVGEAARELLGTAAGDSDPTVSERAKQALLALRPAS